MAEIYIKGRITEIMPLQQGDTDKGHWARQEYVITPAENSKEPIPFSIFGLDHIQAAALCLGGEYIVCLHSYARRVEKDGSTRWFVSFSFGGTVSQPHFDFYSMAMYALRTPGFGVSQTYHIQPVMLRQQAYQYPAAQQPAAGYRQQQPSAAPFPPAVDEYGVPF